VLTRLAATFGSINTLKGFVCEAPLTVSRTWYDPGGIVVP
jgi:hypothetical protein